MKVALLLLLGILILVIGIIGMAQDALVLW